MSHSVPRKTSPGRCSMGIIDINECRFNVAFGPFYSFLQVGSVGVNNKIPSVAPSVDFLEQEVGHFPRTFCSFSP